MKFRILILIMTLMLPLTGIGELYTASTVEEINNSIMTSLEKRNAEKALVIMPLKDFFAEPIDSAFQINDEKSTAVISKAIKKMKSSTSSYVDELILTEYKNKFTDEFIPEFIKNLQKYNAPFMVVSRNVSGSFNKIPYLEVWTWKYLLDHGVDLSKSPIGLNQIIFNKQYKKIKGTYPTFYKGLLSCNNDDSENSPQSIIISLLLNELKWMPDVIYIIDRDENYIKSLVQQFKSVRQNVQVNGYIYTPAKIENASQNIKELTIFWDKLVNKLNYVTRKETKENNNPYE